jgi:hypothetical protein
MKGFPRQALALAACIAALPATADTGSFTTDHVAFARNATYHSTTSTTLKQVPGLNVTFNAQGDALLHLCAAGYVYGTGNGALQVTAHIDGSNATGGSVQFFVVQEFSSTPHCFDWIATGLPLAAHTASIWWQLTEAPGASLTGRFDESVLTVTYKRTVPPPP